jgi:hypothetical protein
LIVLATVITIINYDRKTFIEQSPGQRHFGDDGRLGQVELEGEGLADHISRVLNDCLDLSDGVAMLYARSKDKYEQIQGSLVEGKDSVRLTSGY